MVTVVDVVDPTVPDHLDITFLPPDGGNPLHVNCSMNLDVVVTVDP
jgi:hypothetical protein